MTTLTQQTVDAFMERIKAMDEQELAEILAPILRDDKALPDDYVLLLDWRQAELAIVAAIEKKMQAMGRLKGPTTAECRRIAKGKV